MDEEVVDVIDERNKVLFQVSKIEAHHKGLLHRTVISEIIDSKGNWSLVKQSGGRQDPGQYVSPVGGHVKAGETEEEALKREAQEEAGLKDFEFKLTGRFIFNRNVRNHIENHLFVVFEVYSDKPLRLNEEAESYKKFTDDQLKSTIRKNPKMFGGAFFAVLKEFYPHILAA